jgi:hypothetical protein
VRWRGIFLKDCLSREMDVNSETPQDDREKPTGEKD